MERLKKTKLLKASDEHVAIIDVDVVDLVCEYRPRELLTVIRVFIFDVFTIDVDKEVKYVPTVVLVVPVVPPI